jgi:predicted nucleotidyltransferase
MNLFNEDFIDFLNYLNKNKVSYILVGGYAVVIRGYSRTTGDIDIWVEKNQENYLKLNKALVSFGLPSNAITLDSFLSPEFDVFSIGKPPFAIEIMTAVKGLDYKQAFDTSTMETIDGIEIRVVHLNQLRQAKAAAGRHKDLNDLENLPS